MKSPKFKNLQVLVNALKQKRDNMVDLRESETVIYAGAGTSKEREVESRPVAIADEEAERMQLCSLSSPLLILCSLPSHHLIGSGVSCLFSSFRSAFFWLIITPP